MNLPTKQKQTHRHTEQTCGCQGGGGWEKDGVGGCGQQMQTITYRMDKQQVLLYSTGNYIQYPMINHNGKEYKKECIYIYIYIYICITESLFYTAEINTTL